MSRWPIILLVLCILLSGCGGSGNLARRQGDPVALVYNSVADLLAGDLQETTTRATALGELRGVPAEWPLVGLGTTAVTHRNGEIVILGTMARPELLWCDPNEPHPVVALNQEPLPFLAVAACDPRRQLQVALRPGEDLHAQVQQFAAAQQISLAAVSVSGTFQDVRGTIAYNLRKEGTPLTQPGVDVTPYLLPFQAPPAADWQFAGFYTATPEGQALLSTPGRPLHLHGARTDRALGGHLSAATVVQAALRLYPLPPPLIRQCDLTVGSLRLSGDTVSFQVANIGANTVAPVSLRGVAGNATLFQSQLASLGPGQARELTVTPSWPDAGRQLRVEVDWANEVRESREDNNVAAL